MNCIICFEKLNNEPCYQCEICNNQFHNECIQKWFKKKKTCPMCRSVIYLSNDDYDYDYENDLEDYVSFSEQMFVSMFIQFYIRTFFDIIKEILILASYILVIIIVIFIFKNILI